MDTRGRDLPVVMSPAQPAPKCRWPGPGPQGIRSTRILCRGRDDVGLGVWTHHLPDGQAPRCLQDPLMLGDVRGADRLVPGQATPCHSPGFPVWP